MNIRAKKGRNGQEPHYGGVFRAIRDDMGLDQKSIVAGSTIVQEELSKLERNVMVNPRIGTIRALAKGYGMHPAVLVFKMVESAAGHEEAEKKRNRAQVIRELERV